MSNPTFTQAERRPLVVPLLLALVLLAAAVAVARHFFPATYIDVEALGTQPVPTHTVFASNSKVIGTAQSEDTLFLVSTVRVRNRTREPIYLDGAALSLTDVTGKGLTVKALERADLPNVEASFPQLAPLMAHPLTRNTTLDPGASVEGTVLFSTPLTPDQWRTRKAATLEIDLYHRAPSYVTLPTETAK